MHFTETPIKCSTEKFKLKFLKLDLERRNLFQLEREWMVHNVRQHFNQPDVNPRVVENSSRNYEEACLSLPKVSENIKV